ncbi:hypothetical protein CA54_07730 [Symmachiella macrocystis]|uniref:Uncharacterized protein n=1 Tax=Symmachiella macrocystis TaxID=2527985 RepID=A0A5C6BKA4_9PLAN|nr:hypothetical protein [Symmachiella macrocystis]TWU11961.1 hypothetical protein CA54_07730 [Symmachiella macrocystis]
MTNSQHAQPVHETSYSPIPRRRRRWGWALVMGLVCATAAIAAVYILAPPNYMASSVIYIDASPDVLMNAGVHENADYETFKRTQMFRALSRVVLDTALNEPVRNSELKSEGFKRIGDLSLIKTQAFPIDWLETKLSAVEKHEEFFEIQMEYREKPEELAEIVNAITQVYYRDIANESKLNDKRRITKLVELSDQYEQETKLKRDQIKKLKRRLGVNEDEPQTLLAVAEQELTHELQSRWFEQYLERNTLNLQAQQFQKSSLNDDAIKTNPETKELIRTMIKEELKIAAQEVAADRMRADIKLLEETLDDNEHPKLVQLRADLAKQETKIAELNAQLKPTLEATIRDYQVAVREQHQATQAARVEALNESLAALEQELDRRKIRVKSLSVDSFEVKKLQSELERLEKHWQEIEDRIDTLKIEHHGPGRINIAQLAEKPESKIYTAVYTKSAIAGGGAFVLAFALTLLIAPRKLV